MTTYSRIAGVGSYLPKRVMTNADIEKMVDTTNQWIVERTGIHARHIAAPDENAASLAEQAALKAIAAAGVKKDEIDLIIVGTSTPDKFLPSVACLLQDRLGITNNCPAFDVTAACAGFNYGLSIADQYIRMGQVKCALIVGSETLSRLVDWTDRSTCILFGDGAGAVILQPSKEPGILSTHLHAAGQYKELLFTPNGINPNEQPLIKMRGHEVFKVAVNKLGDVLQETLAANNLDPSAIDWLVPHQANLRIIQALAKKLNLPMEKVILTLADQGNTSAASTVLALDQGIRDGRIKRGQLFLMESFGGGFAWGSALIRY
jgi:3-oxoacyl-[acyl-carrier-protein] synthase-3